MPNKAGDKRSIVRFKFKNLYNLTNWLDHSESVQDNWTSSLKPALARRGRSGEAGRSGCLHFVVETIAPTTSAKTVHRRSQFLHLRLSSTDCLVRPHTLVTPWLLPCNSSRKSPRDFGGFVFEFVFDESSIAPWSLHRWSLELFL